MSTENKDNVSNTPNNGVNTKYIDAKPNLILPQSLSSVHVDRAMVAIDRYLGMATITLLNWHPIPKISEEWNLEATSWEIVGEIKIPITAMNALCLYYLSAMTDVNVNSLLNEYISKNPPNKEHKITRISYGPKGDMI